MLATHSNEAKIERTLTQLGCAAQNFCRIAGVGLTRFLQAINGEPGKHFRDEDAAHLLAVLGELYELQVDVDAITGTHIPINFTRLDAVMTALTIRRVAKIAAEENDHALDEQALRATTVLMEGTARSARVRNGVRHTIEVLNAKFKSFGGLTAENSDTVGKGK